MKKGNTIRFSYVNEKDLQTIVEKLGDLVERVKKPKEQRGQFLTAYIVLKNRNI